MNHRFESTGGSQKGTGHFLTKGLNPFHTGESLPSSFCFRTDAEGRFPLLGLWPDLFQACAHLDSVAFQTRHGFARLVHAGPLPVLTWSLADGKGRDDAGRMVLDPSLWQGAWGRVQICHCCGTTGRIEIRDAQQAEVLQICPGLEMRPLEWAQFLDPWVDRAASAGPHVVAKAERKQTYLPAPTEAKRSSAAPWRWLDLLACLRSQRVPVEVELSTPEATHRRCFVPETLDVSGPLLTLGQGTTCLQFVQPAVASLAHSEDGRALHLQGHHEEWLLTLRAVDGHVDTFEQTMRDLQILLGS